MSSGRSIPTVDRISDLPDSILSHILSFLPTKLSATTSILSKRWKPVWLSVLILNFDYKEFNFVKFRKFVYSIMFSLRDKDTSIQSFILKLGKSSRFRQREFNRILKFVTERGVKHLNLNLSDKARCIKLPLSILSCKTLQVLRLDNIKMWSFDRVDFPCLKTLHLDRVDFTSPEYFVKFINGCPILQDLNAKSCKYHMKFFEYPTKNFHILPNLVKVSICYDMDFLKTLVRKTRIWHAFEMWVMTWKTLPMFHNLTHMKLSFDCSIWRKMCLLLIGKLPSFPKLQHFNILVVSWNCPGAMDICSECLNVPPNPVIAPECLSTQLKTFRINGYTGRECEFKFVKYIMKHSKVLETLKIKSTFPEKNQMFMKLLSSCTRSSTTCKLLFD